MPDRPSLMGFVAHLRKEYTKPSSKLITTKSDKEGLRVGTLSNGKKYSIRDDRRRYFFPHEWKSFWDCLETDQQRLTFDVLINTGARITEATNVKWTDVDWEKNTMTLKVTKIKSAKGETTSKPRTIKLSTSFIKRLARYNNALDNGKLGMMSQPYTRNMIKRYCKKAGIKDYWNFAPHNFRKTHGNWLKALGVDGLEICNRLGHDMNTFIKAYGSSDVFSKEEKIEIRRIVGDIYE